MAKVGAQRAAELTGRSKSTIQRAMKQGKLSFEIDAGGRRLIDVSELERAFGLAPQDGGAGEPERNVDVEAELEKAAQMLEAERMKMRIRMLEDQLDIAREQIEDLKAQRDQWQRQAQQVLLTSQYSQKQAEEYKSKLEEREKIARQRRQQAMQSKSGTAPSSAQQSSQQTQRPVGPMERQRSAPQNAAASVTNVQTPEDVKPGKIFGIQGLWGKIRGQDAVTAPVEKGDKVA